MVHMRHPSKIIHIPHSSTLIPGHILGQYVLSDLELEAELIRMTDRYTDELFSTNIEDVTHLRFPISRLAVDPERFREDNQETMAARGMGAVYMSTVGGSPLRHPLLPQERENLLKQYYDPHHEELTRLVSTALEESSQCLIIDAHSFPSHALPCDIDQSPKRPDICIGTDDYHTPDELLQTAKGAFSTSGWTVKVNSPYSGTIVPMRYYQSDKRVSSLMVEINRRLYMDEVTGSKLSDFNLFQIKFQECLHNILAIAKSSPASKITIDP